MSENSRMFKRVTAFVLTLVMALSLVVASPATTAEAASSYAKKLTLTRSGKTVTALTVTAGSSKSIQAKVTAKGKVSKTVTAKSSKTSIATVKVVNKKYVKVTGKKAGKSTITVTTKAKNAKGKKLSKKVVVTVKAAAAKQTIALAVKEATIAVKGTATIEPTVAPAGSTVTYTSSDATVATVDAKGVVTGVKAGVAEITCANGTATATFTVTVKDVILKEVKQTKMNLLEAVVEGDLSKVTKDSFKITNNDTKVAIIAKAVTKDDKTGKVTIETFANMSDGKEYSVDLDGVVLTFTATDGKVAGVNVTPLSVVAGKATEIKAQIVDANGIIINEVSYSKTLANVDFEIKTTSGYTSAEKLTLPKVGDTATATVTYHTYKYDASANEIGAIKKEFTITAVDSEVTVSNFKYTISGANVPDWTKAVTEEHKISLSNAAKSAYFYFVNSEGTEVTGDYKVESGDNSVLLLGKTDLTNGQTPVTLVPIKEGTTVLNIIKDDKVVVSLPVEVTAKNVLKTIKVNRTSVTLATDVGAVTEDIVVTGYDQNGDEIAIASATAEVVTDNDNPSSYFSKGEKFAGVADGSKQKITLTSANSTKVASHTLKITAANGDDVSAPVTVSVNCVATAKATSEYKIEASTEEFDLKATKDSKEANISATIVEYKNGAKIGAFANDAVTSYVVKKDGKEVSTLGITVTTGSGVAQIDAIDVAVASPMTVTKKIPTGTYTFEITVKSGTAVNLTRTATIKVVDTQPTVVASLKKNDGLRVSSGGAVATTGAIQCVEQAKLVLTSADAGLSLTYDGKKADWSGTKAVGDWVEFSAIAIEEIAINNGVYIKKASVTVKDKVNNIQFTAPVTIALPFMNCTTY